MNQELSVHFLTQIEIELWAWSIGVLLLGFVLALLIHRRSSWTLRRVPYFVAVAALVVLQSLVSMAWLASSNVIEFDGVWLFAAVILFGLMVFGYLYGMISLARSLNAFGNGRAAWMAVVPIAFLVLWFKAPLDDKKPDSVIRTAGNAVAVVLGLALLVLSQIINYGSYLAVDYLANSAKADTGLSATSRQAKAQPQTLSRTQASTSVPALRGGVIQIKGLHNAMDLNEVLMAIHRKGGTCSSSEDRVDLSKTVVSTFCRIHDETRNDDWAQSDIFLSSDRTRSGLILTTIHFDCSYINTCGMSSNKVIEALRGAGVLSIDSNGDLIRIDREGGIWLSMIKSNQPNFN